MTISTKWFINLDRAEQKNLAELLPTYIDDPVLRQLRVVLENQMNLLLQTAKADYDKDSWPNYQAHKNGQIEQLRDTLSLLDIGAKR